MMKTMTTNDQTKWMVKHSMHAVICLSALFVHFPLFAGNALDELKKKYGRPDLNNVVSVPTNPSEQVTPPAAETVVPATVTEEVSVSPVREQVESNEAVSKEENKKSVQRKEVQSRTNIYTIQIGSYPNEDEAAVRVQELAQRGQSAVYAAVKVNQKTWYRVTLGTFSSYRSAKTHLSENLAATLKEEAIVVKLAESHKKTQRAPRTIATQTQQEMPKHEHVVKAENPSVKSEESQENNGLFGDWGGLKTGMKSYGVETLIRYKGDAVQNFRGGIEQKTGYLGNLDIITDFNLEEIAGLDGVNAVFYGLGNHGDSPAEFVGDSYGVSNIAAPNTFKLYEAYLKKNVDDRLTMILGLRDLNADFYAVESTASLINSAFGISPAFSQTGVNGPSIFPNTALALTIKYTSPNTFYFQSGAFNAKAGDPEERKGTRITTETNEGYIYISEMGAAGGKGADRFKYGVGAWTYSMQQQVLSPEQNTGLNSGIYVLLDRNITQDISAFIKYGNANPEINKVARGVEAGIVFQGLIPQRSEDKLAIGFAKTTISEDYKMLNSSKDEESVTELSYQLKATDGVFITPDFQFIKNPGVSQDVSDAQVGLVRVEIQF